MCAPPELVRRKEKRSFLAEDRTLIPWPSGSYLAATLSYLGSYLNVITFPFLIFYIGLQDYFHHGLTFLQHARVRGTVSHFYLAHQVLKRKVLREEVKKGEIVKS